MIKYSVVYKYSLGTYNIIFVIYFLTGIFKNVNLIVDFGNTRIKAALFEEGIIVQHKIYNNVKELISDTPFYRFAKNSIICSVTGDHTQFINSLAGKNKVLLFSANTPIPLKNLYQNAATLGSDRIAASIGSFTLYPGKNVLTIDAGTCIKYNFVNTANEYIGGAISPGLNMRLKSLNSYTNRLPLIEPDFNYEKLTGQDTRESILSGALIGAAFEVEEMISRYKTLYKNLIVVVTGGDAPYLCKQLKNCIFAHPDILMIGLNTILDYNIEK